MVVLFHLIDAFHDFGGLLVVFVCLAVAQLLFQLLERGSALGGIGMGGKIVGKGIGIHGGFFQHVEVHQYVAMLHDGKDNGIAGAAVDTFFGETIADVE